MNTIAQDNFREYYTEKFWEMIPSIYRHEDGEEGKLEPGVLRALVEIMAEQAAVIRRSQDRLWEDQYIDWCSEWAVPYIADLVATRLLPLENKRGRRVDVAKTIYYRRRNGTPRILEELISDITGWDGKMVESFKRLGRMRHGLDPHPLLYEGLFTKTLPGGIANLKNPNGSELAGGPFDEFYYTPDMRKSKGIQGRYNIPKLAFYLYRIKSFEILEVEPFASSNINDLYTFDPSGRNIQLFNYRSRPASWEQWDWTSAKEWELPAPMRCRLLGHALYQITEEAILALETSGISPAAAAVLRNLRGWKFDTEQQFKSRLIAMLAANDSLNPDPTNLSANYVLILELLERTLLIECGKKVLTDNSVSVEVLGTVILPGKLMAGNLLSGAVTISEEKKLIIDSENGRFVFTNMAPPPPISDIGVNYHYGFSGSIGAGAYNRTTAEITGPPVNLIQGGGNIPSGAIINPGVTHIEDNKTYSPIGNKNSISSLTLQAANQKRPYISLTGHWRLRGANDESCLVLDGLWVGAVANEKFEIRLRGSYECVLIKNCTFDPGGDSNIDGDTINPVTLLIDGNIEKLIILSSITGPIKTSANGHLEEVYFEDSIIQSVDSTMAAIDFNSGTVNMNRTTILGEMNVHRLFASEVLCTGLAKVTDTQNGCFRFSVGVRKRNQLGTYDQSILPRPFESHILEDANYWFASRKFGHYAYGQLSEMAPQEIREGAENKSEIGAFSSQINPIKKDSLEIKVSEYMPFGLIPLFINET